MGTAADEEQVVHVLWMSSGLGFGESDDLIPPGTFLYIGERFDLIQLIDRWVLRRAIGLLAELGCEVALDDFGAGFASFYYLKHMAFDYVKIDGEFIRNLADSHVNQLVVKSVVDIARGLGKRTIAEFVGDEEGLELLKRYGVDYAQGFYLAKPQPLGSLDLTALPA